MSLAAVVSFLVSLAKAIPALASLANQFEAAWRAERLKQTNDAIDAAVAAAQASPWVCPAACPHAQRLRDAQPASPAVPLAPRV
jgi:hypothetical protein